MKPNGYLDQALASGLGSFGQALQANNGQLATTLDAVVGAVDLAAGYPGATGTAGFVAEDIRLTGTALARSLGQAGEQAVGVSGPKVGVAVPNSTTIRFPDILTQSTIGEVKNVQYQALTQQVRDYLSIAQDTSRTFSLYVRPSTKFSGPLQDLITNNKIDLQFIPGAK
jgi:hypothetical protein